MRPPNRSSMHFKTNKDYSIALSCFLFVKYVHSKIDRNFKYIHNKGKDCSIQCDEKCTYLNIFGPCPNIASNRTLFFVTLYIGTICNRNFNEHKSGRKTQTRAGEGADYFLRSFPTRSTPELAKQITHPRPENQKRPKRGDPSLKSRPPL
jgi:hypothetical protein